MKKKLSKYGNSWALLIDKPILDLLSINELTELRIRTDGICLIIEPITTDPEESKDDIKSASEKIIARYSTALKKLADN